MEYQILYIVCKCNILFCTLIYVNKRQLFDDKQFTQDRINLKFYKHETR